MKTYRLSSEVYSRILSFYFHHIKICLSNNIVQTISTILRKGTSMDLPYRIETEGLSGGAVCLRRHPVAIDLVEHQVDCVFLSSFPSGYHLLLIEYLFFQQFTQFFYRLNQIAKMILYNPFLFFHTPTIAFVFQALHSLLL